ncbi:hypothetical protein [Amycolatopsis sp.]|uniref:hypothetical protein n=1 Tax=Amycolatopsis sp. TaxID=37632 RepID=UPI002C299D42|nr:hypothetical protein [Amycolatopsis sp.]HVV10742.1 hypothetical protein [Amycolatopsis sp.]
MLAAAALIVGGSIGFIIGHSSGSGSSTPTSGQLGPGGMGGYGGGMGGYGPPDGGTGGMPGQQQGSSATSTQSST